jgi:hypothetical protein
MTTTTTATTTKNNETKAINAFCDVCDNQDFDKKKALESAGWELSPAYQLCPNCAIG